jgi:eukaryotic-like serine/threonine-protein kinase
MEERCGTWRLEQLIAVGGIGEVWRASGFPGSRRRLDEDRATGGGNGHERATAGAGGPQVAAIKRLHTHLLRHDVVGAMFETEQRILCELPRHPGLVHGLDRSEAPGPAAASGDVPWVAMRLVEGTDLRRFLDGGAAERGVAAGALLVLPPAAALVLLAKVCDAVAHLHEHGWVHGDVVPANLLVDALLTSVMLCDFGVARRSGGGGPVQGTHAYMAPEQARGEAWTPATDVFALGVILWELLAGKRLFHRGPPWLAMQAVLEEAPPPLADPSLDAIARDALAKDPAKRIPDARALLRRLEACGVALSS